MFWRCVAYARCKYVHLFTVISLFVVSNIGMWYILELNTDCCSCYHKNQVKLLESKLLSIELELRRLNLSYSSIPQLGQLLTTALPVIYVVTPTYSRPVQKAELTRLKNTFLHIPSLHWIVVEDSISRSELVSKLLLQSGLHYSHLSYPTPAEHKLQSTDPRWLRARGVLQRNAGLSWLRRHLQLSPKAHGVIYFADDDNTYDLRLFNEMRFTKRVSVWPVGLAGYLRYERPVVGSSGHVIGWFTAWKPRRSFALDMAGFAINTHLLMTHPTVEFNYNVSRGEQESYFLSQLVVLADLEPKANNCTQVLVWHTRTEPANLKNEEKLRTRGLQGSDLSVEV